MKNSELGPGQSPSGGVRRYERRRLLRLIGTLGAAGVSGYLSDVLAAGDAPPGLHKLDGTGTINGKPAQAGSPIALGDRIATGPNSQAIVVLKGDAFLMRANTQVEIAGSGGVLSSLTIATGRVLSVFAKKPVSIKAASATIGIRGTGAYVEVEPSEVYFCLCYGVAAVSGPNMKEEVVQTRHHEKPMLLTTSGGTMKSAPGGFRNHKDDELVMLEALMNREPPFIKGGQYPAVRY